MAVRKIGQTERYVGLSGDAKPTPSLAHAIFYELDTGKEFKWDIENTSWEEQVAKYEGETKLVDDDGNELFTESNPGNTQLTGSNAVQGAVQNVTTAGTRVQLPSIACREITIIALRANTGYIYVGGSDVSDTVYGAELAALDSITIAVENANLLYIDASVSGEGVSYVTV